MTETNGSGAPSAAQPDQAKTSDAGSSGANAVQTPTATEPPSTATAENQGAESIPRKGGFQRKIEKLTQETEYWRNQVLNRDRPETPKEPVKTEEKVPRPDDFDSYDEYVRADARYQARQEVKKTLDERDQSSRLEALRTEQQKRVTSYNDKAEQARTKYEDFDEVLAGSDAPMTEAMRDAVLESDLGPEVVYYLAQNPEKADAMAKMGVTALNREVGRIEALLEAQSKLSPSPAPAADKRPTKAPAPIKAVNAGAAKTGETYRKDMSQGEFNAMRARQIAERRDRSGR